MLGTFLILLPLGKSIQEFRVLLGVWALGVFPSERFCFAQMFEELQKKDPNCHIPAQSIRNSMAKTNSPPALTSLVSSSQKKPDQRPLDPWESCWGGWIFNVFNLLFVKLLGEIKHPEWTVSHSDYKNLKNTNTQTSKKHSKQDTLLFFLPFFFSFSCLLGFVWFSFAGVFVCLV